MQKPRLARGTRDFAPEVMDKRNHILNIIRSTFEKFAFQALETPAVERLDVLTGKYGEEGEQLIFKILNSGDFLKKVRGDDFKKGASAISPKIAEKALRYDLTVPFARFVSMNRGNLSFPFKRYQIQPVWRGDNPQKGRYREFYQCDADVVGTESMLCEAEIVLMINEVLAKLNIQDFNLKINHRQVLAGMAEYAGHPELFTDMCVAIDKLDKIGLVKVQEELSTRGFSAAGIERLSPLLAEQEKSFAEKIKLLEEIFANSELGQKGLEDIREIQEILKHFGDQDIEHSLHVDFDMTLARGLSYYTGSIFEVKVNQVQIGSISGGGRYDNLTGAFGMPDMPGVGFSFGVDRIYDVMEELDLFPKEALKSSQLMFTNFDAESRNFILPWLKRMRDQGIRAEIYPDSAKLNKQMKYANRKNIPFVVFAGEEELKQGMLNLKDMETGEQVTLKPLDLLDKFTQKRKN